MFRRLASVLSSPSSSSNQAASGPDSRPSRLPRALICSPSRLSDGSAGPVASAIGDQPVGGVDHAARAEDRGLVDAVVGAGDEKQDDLEEWTAFSSGVTVKRRSRRLAPARIRVPHWPMFRRSDWRASSPRTERGHQVAKIVRDKCVFAKHNLAQDPPFSKLDLISCCNVLIYLGEVLQRKVWSIFQYALKPAGFLVLGPSESVGTLSESFHQVDKTHKIYCMRPAAGTPALPLSEGRRTEGRMDLRERDCRRPNRAGRAERSRPVSAGRAWPRRRHH